MQVHKNEATDSQLTVSSGTSPAEDITSAYRGLLAAAEVRRVTVSRGTMTAPGAERVDKDTVTDCTAVDRASSPVKVRSLDHHFAVVFTGWLGSRMVSVLDSGAVGPGFKS